MRKFVLTLLSIAAASSSAAYADTAAEMEKRLKEQYPATRISAVRTIPAKGIFEVVMGRNVAYTDETGRYMIFGHLYDMKEQRDLTAGVLEAINKVDVSALPDADAIVMVRGKGERKLYVFSDPDCPYCKRLEAELAKLDNVTILTFMMPLEQLHPEAKGKSIATWCSADRAAAWRSLMASDVKGVVSAAQTIKLPCENPIARNLELADRLGINGTPTIIFENGQKASGALPAIEIQRRMAAGEARRINGASGG